LNKRIRTYGEWIEREEKSLITLDCLYLRKTARNAEESGNLESIAGDVTTIQLPGDKEL